MTIPGPDEIRAKGLGTCFRQSRRSERLSWPGGGNQHRERRTSNRPCRHRCTTQSRDRNPSTGWRVDRTTKRQGPNLSHFLRRAARAHRQVDPRTAAGDRGKAPAERRPLTRRNEGAHAVGANRNVAIHGYGHARQRPGSTRQEQRQQRLTVQSCTANPSRLAHVQNPLRGAPMWRRAV